jgi:hypothetical protein
MPAAVLLFSGAFLLANRLHLFICSRVPGIACIRAWPTSLVFARVPPQIGYPSLPHVTVGVGSLLLLFLAFHVLERVKYSPPIVTAFGLALILATTLTHGWQFGLTRASAGLETRARSPLNRLTLVAVLSFLLVLLTGAYRTGETARAALFMVPFLTLPIAKRVAAMHHGDSEFRILAALVFLQALIMQLVGDFWW